MKIAIYSTQVIPTKPDPDQYTGLEMIAGLQAKYFEEVGHHVSLFASKKSYQPENGHLYAVGEPGKTNPYDAFKAYWNDEKSRKALIEADIVVDHSWGYFPYSVHDKLKNICHICHGPDTGFKEKPPVEKPNLIAVSHNHAKQLSNMTGCTFRGVQNGIDLEKYPYQKEKGNYFLWLGRIYAFKGTHRFIDICNKGKLKGKIAGGSFGDVKDYVDLVKDMIKKSKYVDQVGQIGTDSEREGQRGVGVTHQQKVELYQNAKAVVLPSVERLPIQNQPGKYTQFIEPFGLITPEANACGTPVITIPSGGWHETMVHGNNGFHANSDEEFIYYMNRVDDIEPWYCRRTAEHFSYRRMGDEYLSLFKEIIEGRGW